VTGQTITLAPELDAVVRPGVLWWSGAVVAEHEPRLDALLAAAETRLRHAAPQETPAVRAMYRRLGIDPTKTRPSNEALLRRVRKGEPLPRVNALVDIINWCSAELQLPYGLYDLSQVSGGVTLRIGQPGEAYDGIRKDTVHVSGRLTLADEQGPFGNPTSDSKRTMVTTATTEALVVVFAPAGEDSVRLTEVLDLTATRIADVCGGREVRRVVNAGAGSQPS